MGVLSSFLASPRPNCWRISSNNYRRHSPRHSHKCKSGTPLERKMNISDAAREIRKLRKKLRQIENLELLSRPLNDAEKLKVALKNNIRGDLQRTLSSLPRQSLRNLQDSIPTANLISKDEEMSESSEALISILDDAGPRIEEPNETAAQELRGTTNSNDSLKRQRKDKKTSETVASTLQTLKRLKSNGKQFKEQSIQENLSCSDNRSYKQNLERLWRTSEFTVRVLDGHSDLISAVAADGNIIVSASFDTTVKVWNGDTGQETFSLRGHTGSVTCLVMPSKDDSTELCRYLGLAELHRVALTGSTDCSIILWSLTSGKMLKSIYTFNTITCLVYVASEICIVTATDGGKVEVWDAVAGTSLRGFTLFDESYTCMKAFGSHIYVASSDGIIKIWELCERDLIPRFTLEQLGGDSEDGNDDGDCGGKDIVVRHVRCLDACQDWVFYGDDGVNLKAFNWKNCKMKKFVNHSCDSGATDGVICTSREIVSTSYDLDSGKGHLNVRLFPTGDYLCSLFDGDMTKMSCLANSANAKVDVRIVTGGAQLKIWDVTHLPTKNKRFSSSRTIPFKTLYVARYAREATNSEYESSCETDDSSELGDHCERTYIPRDVSERSSGWSFCSIV